MKKRSQAVLALLLAFVMLAGTLMACQKDDIQVMGTTNFDNLGLGSGTTDDISLTYDGNAQDFYIALDDSADDLLIGLGSAVGTTPAIGVDENLAVTFYGDQTFGGTTPVLTLGDAGAEDTALVYDGNAQDFYIALDDNVDDLILGLGSAVGTTGIIYLDENQDVGLGGASAGAKLDVTGQGIYDGAADEVQLTVQGYTTQTNNILLVEQSGGTDLFWIDNNGDVEMNGTTPLLTIGDAGTEDTAIVFDGNAQDYYVALDDDADDLIIGLGSTVGTTPIISMDENQTVVMAADVRFSAQTAITITQSGSLAPTGVYQPIQAGGAVSFSTITAGTAGDLLVLINISSNAITITDTGTTMLSGNLALGQYDTVTLWSDGTNWIQLATSNN